MSALRRLLSIAANASGSREITPNEAANLAASEQLSALNPPEVEPAAGEGDETGRNVEPQ